MSATLRCKACQAEFDDRAIRDVQGCPNCGSTEQAEVIGELALCHALVEEYLSVKADVVEGRMPVRKMTARQQAGLLIRTYGRDHIAEFFRKMPRRARRGYLATWPALRETLAAAGISLDGPLN